MSGQTQDGMATTRVNKARFEAAVAVYLGGRFLDDDEADPTAALTRRCWDRLRRAATLDEHPLVMAPGAAAHGAAR